MFVDFVLPGYRKLRHRFVDRYMRLKQGGLPDRDIHKRLKIAAKYQRLGFIEDQVEFFTKYERRYFRRALKKIRLLIPMQRPYAALWPPDPAAQEIFHAFILIENAALGGIDTPITVNAPNSVTQQMKDSLLTQSGLAQAASHALALLEGQHRIFNRWQYWFTLKYHPV